MPRTKDQVLQRFVRPKVVKGARAHFVLSAIRRLIKKEVLEPNRQFLAIHLLLYLEGMIDKLPRLYAGKDSSEAVAAEEIDSGLKTLVESLNAESAAGNVKPHQTAPSENHSDEAYADIVA